MRSSKEKGFNLGILAIFVAFSALAAGSIPEAGFEGDDAYVATGEGVSQSGIKGKINQEASAKHAARIEAERQFIEACTSSGAAGGGCRERTAEDTDLQGRTRSAKVTQSECKDLTENIGTYTCRLSIRIEMKGLRATCARRQKEPGICIR